jgi:type VI secretion system protein VasG
MPIEGRAAASAKGKSMPSLDLGRMIQRLDGELVVALEEAVAIAVRHGHESVEAEHWFIALGATSRAYAHIVETCGGNLQAIDESANRAMERFGRGGTSAPSISSSIIDMVREAWIYASLQHGRLSLDALDLLYTALTDATLRALAIGGMPPLRDIRIGELERLIEERPQVMAASDVGAARAAGAAGSGDFLSQFTIDMTEQARSGGLDPVVGRDAEMRQLIDILVRRRQNNPILVGEAGVGKTAVVEAFALEIASGNVPEPLQNIRLLNLDLTLLQAGAGVKGEFERRLKGVIDEVKASAEPVILFIDEAHTMIGAGGQAGQGDAANILKPALARGELRTIAATTWAEYKKYFEKDAALTRRFQTVQILEPDEETAVQMVRSLVPTLEKHHGVKIRDAAVRAAVSLSTRYIQARQLPDKAVSLIDTACAAVFVSRATTPAQIQDAERTCELLRLEEERLKAEPDQEAVAERLADIALQLTGLETQLAAHRLQYEAEQKLVTEADAAEGAEKPDTKSLLNLESRLQELQGEMPLIHRIVDKETVAAVVARWTGIPLGKLMRDLVETVQTLEDRLRERVIGQDRALKTIADAMVTARANLGDERRPPGVFLMVGTSGVGKTETALVLASLIYGGEDNLTVINMSEFKEEHKVSLLLGSPPGYVGYGEGGILTEAVRRRPYGALLLDEIDKAHSGVQDIFYQVFDKGTLKDGEGRDIDFKNTTILMTANTGTKTLTALAADPDTMPEGDALVDMLQTELLEQFKPAFLGRLTIVPYLPLDENVLRQIIGLQLEKIRKRLEKQHKAKLEVSDAVLDVLVKRSQTIDSGARAVESTLAREILPSLSRQILALTLMKALVSSAKITVDDSGHILVKVT